MAVARYLTQTTSHVRPQTGATPTAAPEQARPTFDPSVGAPLPKNRVVAFYAVPGAAATGPAYQLSPAMLTRLKDQAAQYQALDPQHPVVAGIDLVVSVPDGYRGPAGTYSHHVDNATIDSYVEFCRTNGLVLFLDLNFGWTDPLTELNAFREYLKLPFVHVAVDPEWMFPRHNGVPGTNLANVRASDLNPLIQAVAAMPEEYKVPRKMFLIHQYRPDGDGLADPYDPSNALIADKRNLVNDDRVDVIIHVDSVGGWPGDIELKEQQYSAWVAQSMQQYGNFKYGGFKIFYQLESKHRLMTPQEVMALQPQPMVITYGN
ncbi:hypothetical protein [Dactylosporangium sp. CA-233914]|uniref:hypothetical protein n=1 Tax=Dactylosporangium sp. CA-233914 TaxID=3239934 RepID=UPI003D8FF51F